MSPSRSRGGATGSATGSKVPAVNAYFWIVKALTTALGEAVSDYLVHAIAPVAAVLIGFVAFCVALTLQFRARRYVTWAYWGSVAMVGIFGTMAADVLHVGLGVPYVVSAAIFFVVLVAVFGTWHRIEGNLSIHSITTPRREMFYWAAVIATFALGTAVGDLAASTGGLGYFAAGVIFAVLIALTAVAYRWFGINSVLAFWVAYVLTRPLGASFADWCGKPLHVGGLGIGAGTVSAVLAVLIAVFVGYFAYSKVDVPDGV